MSEIRDWLKAGDIKPEYAYEVYVCFTAEGWIRLLAKDRDRPRVFDITNSLRDQFGREDS